jgi:RNA polymerase-binding transcription factor DksA
MKLCGGVLYQKESPTKGTLMIDTSHYRRKLEDRLTELGARLAQIKDELDDPLPKDWEDQATAEEGDEVLQSLGAAGKGEIALIRAALNRIGDGTFGVCQKCGDDIAPERLAILPHAPLCADCAGGRRN